jgi:hypothetical protein
MTVSINGTTGIVFNDASAQNTAATGFGFKNRIINGAMMIDQRNAGAEINPAVNGNYCVDRWLVISSQTSKFKIGQDAGAVTPPAGFVDYLGLTSLSSYSITSSDTFAIRQLIEGFNVADLGWGTANAQPVTLSFWVRSSLTGTFGGSLRNSAQTRSYPFSYTISAANTWEQKSITIVGDTTGTWLTNNGVGINVQFSIGAGSSESGTAGAWVGTGLQSATGAVSVVGTSGATFYITGVQLEKGSTATSFDYRSYGTELALCQRYYFPITLPRDSNECFPAIVYSATTILIQALPVTLAMRATPSITTTIGTAAISFYRYDGTLASTQTPNAFSVSVRSTNGTYWFELQWTAASSWGSSRNFGAIGLGSGSSSTMNLSAEL